MNQPRATDVVIAGGGIIGLSLGLELLQRGLSVTVLERHTAMRAASWAAGGMLAAHDPENPPALLPLSLRSLALYPAYLEKIHTLSSQPVPLRTRRTLQQIKKSGAAPSPLIREDIDPWIPGFANKSDEKFIWLEEESLDPRDLCRALPQAFSAAKGILLEETAVLRVESSGQHVVVETSRDRLPAHAFVNCCGAWAAELLLGAIPVQPVKGQAVSLTLAPERMRCVLRTSELYAIPRGDGRITVGATIEHAGFDTTVQPASLASLLKKAAKFLPEIHDAPWLESWAGLRPGTPDGLPILGPAEMEQCWHATGHYRNGVLLAPVTARVLAQIILGESADVPLDAFSPARFRPQAVAGSGISGCNSVASGAKSVGSR